MNEQEWEDKLAEVQKNSEHWYNKYKELKNQNKLLGERCNQLLKDKGDLTDELAKWKDEWQEQVQKATDEGWERTKLTGRVRELEQQIEKMKCCGNCRFSESDTLNGTFCHREGCFVVASAKCKLWEM